MKFFTLKNVLQSKVYHPRDTLILKNIYNQEKIIFFSFSLDITLALSDLTSKLDLDMG